MRIGLAGIGRIGAFHAETLAGLDGVDQLVVADLDQEVAQARRRPRSALGGARRIEALLDGGIDGSSIATATAATPPCSRAGGRRGHPDVLREAGRAGPSSETIALAQLDARARSPSTSASSAGSTRGYSRVREAVAAGEIGFVHTVRAETKDQAPPHAAYLPTSGGMFRDCSVHDFDIIRFVTGREVRLVYATGANKGAAFFTEAGDVDTGATLVPSTTTPSSW